jgi:hypothetical protein
MRVSYFFPALIFFFGGKGHAQQTLIHVPSNDITEAKKVFVYTYIDTGNNFRATRAVDLVFAGDKLHFVEGAVIQISKTQLSLQDHCNGS